MKDSKSGAQTIGCEVNSCQYFNDRGMCDLNHIVVKPCASCNTGRAEDETLCGSYQKK